MRRAPFPSLILLAVLLGLVLVGPNWPAIATELVCGESPERMNVREVVGDMNACVVAMGRADAAGTHCFCHTRETWRGPAYYLGLLPLVLIAGVWLGNRPLARGMAAVGAVLGAVLLVPWAVMPLFGRGLRIPIFVQTMAVFWPQFVFFVASLFRANPPRLAVPPAWSYISSLIFWAIAAAVFGLVVRRVKSFGVLLVLAAAFVAATVALVRWVVPLFGWRLIFEGP